MPPTGDLNPSGPRKRDFTVLKRALRGCFVEMATEVYGPPTYRSSREMRWRPSGAFVLSLDTWLWCDHAATGPKGRTAGGDLLAGVAHLYQCDIRQAIEITERWCGSAELPEPPRAIETPKPKSNGAWKRIRTDLRPITGTIAETYLRHRGIEWDADYRDVGFHPACPRGRDERLPAMVAIMRNPVTNEITGIHRTFLKPDGSGKVEHGIAKMMLGVAGIVKLIDDAEVALGLGLAEGIETALSVMTAGWRPVWACLSAGGIARFPVLDGIESLTIFADRDEGAAGQNAARACAARWTTAGREATVLVPKVSGTDFNDVVKGRV